MRSAPNSNATTARRTHPTWADLGLWPWLTSSDKVQGNQAKGQHDKAAKNNTIHKPTPHRSRDGAMTYNATALNTPAAMNKGLTGAFWKNGATTEAVKMIFPVSIRTSATRFRCFSDSSTEENSTHPSLPLSIARLVNLCQSYTAPIMKRPVSKRISLAVRTALSACLWLTPGCS